MNYKPSLSITHRARQSICYNDKKHVHSLYHRRSFYDEFFQLHDVIYKTRCPNLFHTEHHQSSFIGNFHIFCYRNENDNGFVIFCSDLSFQWYIGRLKYVRMRRVTGV